MIGTTNAPEETIIGIHLPDSLLRTREKKDLNSVQGL